MKTTDGRVYRRAWITLLLLVAEIGGIVWLWYDVTKVREQLGQAQVELQNVPQQILHRTDLAQSLEARQHDINRLHTLIPSRQEVAGMLTALEAEAGKQNIVVEVTDISEVVVEKDTQPSEDFVVAQIKILADGRAIDLLSFLHQVEHLPYLITLSDWQVAAAGTGANQGISAVEVPATSDDQQTSDLIVASPSSLSATFLVTLRHGNQP